MELPLWVLAIALSAAPADQPSVTIRSTTTLVQVNLAARDARGRPVTGLTKDDFEVFDNGRPQRIATFSVETSASAAPRELPPNIFTNQRGDSGGARGGYSVILLDFLNTGEFRDQVWARQAVEKVVKGMGPNERFALYFLDAWGLRVLSEFGTERDVLLRRLAVLAGRMSPYLATYGHSEGAVIPGLDQGAGEGQGTLNASSGPVSPGQGAGSDEGSVIDALNPPSKVFSEMDGFIADWTVKGTLHTFETIADHLAGVPGRKGLIWVSYGVPGSIDLKPAGARFFPNAMKQTRTYTTEIERAIHKLTNADVAVYGVSSQGVWGNHGPNTLDEFASRTGGLSWRGNGLDTEMQTAIEDVTTSYSLGYYAPPDSDTNYTHTRFHRLKVEVKRPGVKLRYREGYLADTAASPAEDRKAKVVQALLSPADDTTIPIAVKAVHKQGALSLRIALEPASLGLVRRGERWQGRIEFVARFAAEDGKECGAPASKTVLFNLSQRNYEAAARDGLRFTKELEVPRGASKLRLLVREDAAGQIGTLTIPLGRIAGN